MPPPTRLYDETPSLPPTPRFDSSGYNYDLDQIPLSPGLPRHPIAPDIRPYLPARRRLTSSSPLMDKSSFIDELLPTPNGGQRTAEHVVRRSTSLGVITVFLLATIWMACTDAGQSVASSSLRSVFGGGNTAEVGANEWVSTDVDAANGKGKGKDGPDFEQFKKLSTLRKSDLDLTGGKVIFIGDIHGSYDPLQRLLKKVQYDEKKDTIIHVGDLIAKGEKNLEVLEWMAENDVLGVRGNHDQPVLQWRAWMEWAGAEDWEAYTDLMSAMDDEEWTVSTLKKEGKMYPEDWKWKGEHWHIARNLRKSHYKYLQQLPLIIHLPGLHSIVVHAGLLPADPHRDVMDPNNPLVDAAEAVNSPAYVVDLERDAEELSILLDVPQNTDPWNLLNMRSIYTSGKKKGKITKSADKGTPWSDVWNREMRRCTGEGAWSEEELAGEVSRDEGDGIENEEERELGESEWRNRHRGLARGGDEVELEKLKCSPVTVLYGHAAARNLDIKPFSKGIDTGCVYGRELTALVLGNYGSLSGKAVRVDSENGILVSVDCKKGGL